MLEKLRAQPLGGSRRISESIFEGTSTRDDLAWRRSRTPGHLHFGLAQLALGPDVARLAERGMLLIPGDRAEGAVGASMAGPVRCSAQCSGVSRSRAAGLGVAVEFRDRPVLGGGLGDSLREGGHLRGRGGRCKGEDAGNASAPSHCPAGLISRNTDPSNPLSDAVTH